MRKIKLIGTISSILLITNYIEAGFMFLFYRDVGWGYLLNETIRGFIFTVSIVLFYFSLSENLKSFGYKSEFKIIIYLIIIEIVSFIYKIVQYYNDLLPKFVLAVLYFSAIILFILLGVKILKIPKNKFYQLHILKNFVISMFIAFVIVIIVIGVLTLNNKIEFVNFSYMIYSIPYLFGLIYFSKLRISD